MAEFLACGACARCERRPIAAFVTAVVVAPLLAALLLIGPVGCDHDAPDMRADRTTAGAPAALVGTAAARQAAPRPTAPASGAPKPAAAPTSVPAQSAAMGTVRPARERLIDFYTIGGGSRNPATRNVGYVNARGGWSAFVELHARRSYDYGVRRIWLHNPFGNVQGEHFELDQFVAAEEAGLNWLTDDFTAVWKPVVDGRRFGEPVEVVAYIGTAAVREARAGPNTLQRLRHQGRADLWLDRTVRSVNPALAAGMSLGFDTASDEPDHPPDNFTFAFCSLVRALGTRVYIEPRPQLAFTGWHDFNVMSVDRFWLRSDPGRHRDSRWGVPTEQITGEIVRLVIVPVGVDRNAQRTAELAETVRAILREGHTVTMNLKVFREGGWPLERLVAGIDSGVKETAPR